MDFGLICCAVARLLLKVYAFRQILVLHLSVMLMQLGIEPLKKTVESAFWLNQIVLQVWFIMASVQL